MARQRVDAPQRSPAGRGVAPGVDLVLQGTERATCRVWRFSVPYPPSTNALYATVQGRRVKTKVARDYADLVGDMASILAVRRGIPDPPYRLTIDLWAPDLRRRDADNGVKCLQDALIKGTGRDDAEVVVLHVEKRGVDRMHPRADVTLESVEKE